MKLAIVNASVVLAGRDYAPSIFTPEFLRSLKVTKKQWELVESPIVNPVTTLLKYNNGMVFAVNPGSIQIIDGNPPKIVSDSPIGGMANILLKHLTYARHTAIGFNINALIEHEDATNFLRETFFKDGPWVSQEFSSINVSFSYPQNGTTLNMGYVDGVAKLIGESKMRAGIGVTANYHTDIAPEITLDASAREAQKQITLIPNRVTDFLAQVRQVFNLEEATNDGGQN